MTDDTLNITFEKLCELYEEKTDYDNDIKRKVREIMGSDVRINDKCLDGQLWLNFQCWNVDLNNILKAIGTTPNAKKAGLSGRHCHDIYLGIDFEEEHPCLNDIDKAIQYSKDYVCSYIYKLKYIPVLLKTLKSMETAIDEQLKPFIEEEKE